MKTIQRILIVMGSVVFLACGAAQAQSSPVSEEATERLILELAKLSQTIDALRADMSTLKAANQQMAAQLQSSGVYSHSGAGRRIVTSKDFHELGAKNMCLSTSECESIANGVCVDLGFGGVSKVNSRSIDPPTLEGATAEDNMIVITSIICG